MLLSQLTKTASMARAAIDFSRSSGYVLGLIRLEIHHNSRFDGVTVHHDPITSGDGNFPGAGRRATRRSW